MLLTLTRENLFSVSSPLPSKIHWSILVLTMSVDNKLLNSRLFSFSPVFLKNRLKPPFDWIKSPGYRRDGIF